MSGDTPTRNDSSTAEELDQLTGYSGSIQGTPLDSALDEQREALWGAQAIIDMAAAALERHFGTDWPCDVPHYSMALRNASETIDQVAGALEAGVLEDRALAIARRSSAEKVPELAT